MTKQEEIREGLSDLIYGLANRPPDIDKILSYLHSQGVVIRGQSLGFSHPHLSDYYSVEPLIEVSGADGSTS